MAGAIFGEVLMMLEYHFSWQGQCLVKLQCHFSWQAQYLVNFRVIAGAPNVVIFHTKCVSKVGRGSSANGRVAADAFMVGSWSESSLQWQLRFRWLLSHLQLAFFSWQGQHLVQLTCCCRVTFCGKCNIW